MARRLRALSALLVAAGGAAAPLVGPLAAGGARAEESIPRLSRALAPTPLQPQPDAAEPWRLDPHPLTGPRSRLGRDWVGLRSVAADTPILVMAGHADSQNMAGSGTPGAAVALAGAAPMVPGISDELYWNLVITEAVVRLGRERGLTISDHRPPFRTMANPNAPGTNWSVGRAHAARGGYALEIHFDAYGPDGIGSGLIPPLHQPPSVIDESLAQEFGNYPLRYRNVLGGPRRGIALLEIGKLEGTLEASLRDPATRPQTVQAIAERVVQALERGLGRVPVDATPAAASADPLLLPERPVRR